MKTGIIVHDAMTKELITVSPDTTIKACAELMEEKEIGSVIVEEKNRLIGILTEQDIVRKITAKGHTGKHAVKDFMNEKVKTIEPGVDISEAIDLMKLKNVKTLPVKDGDKVIGMLALKDILKIQPGLFEVWVEKMRIREENTKPIFKTNPNEGICEACGEYFPELSDIEGSLLCKLCTQ